MHWSCVAWSSRSVMCNDQVCRNTSRRCFFSGCVYQSVPPVYDIASHRTNMTVWFMFVSGCERRNQSYTIVWATIWVLGIEPKPSESEARALNLRAIFLSPKLLLYSRENIRLILYQDILHPTVVPFNSVKSWNKGQDALELEVPREIWTVNITWYFGVESGTEWNMKIKPKNLKCVL